MAIRAGKRLEWDGPNMKFPNAPDAEKFLRREYRDPWSLKSAHAGSCSRWVDVLEPSVADFYPAITLTLSNVDVFNAVVLFDVTARPM